MDRDHDLVRVLRAHTDLLERGETLPGDALAEALSALTLREAAEGGPYRSLEDPKRTDLGVNLAIARFLAACGVRLPNLDAYLEREIASGTAHSAVLDDEALVEAVLWHERALDAPAADEDGPLSYDDAEARVLAELRAAMARRLEGTSEEIREGATFVIERTIRANPDKQMSLMAEYLRRALGRAGSAFSDAYLGELGFANACFWSSFIVYDDFWDEDEAAEPRLLPVANLLARHYVRAFTELLPEAPAFAEYFHAVMDRLDAANAWETVACRMRVEGDRVSVPAALPAYGDFSIKFYPAAGHVMGPVAMLVSLGYGIDSAEVRGLVSYFEHYLVAMQLNDDAHDWKEDLARGHISTAVSVLLATWKEAHPDRDVIDLATDMPELERLFWFEALDPLCEAVLDRVAKSRAALESIFAIEDPAPLARFIDRNEAIALRAMRERKQSEEFLASFKGVGA